MNQNTFHAEEDRREALAWLAGQLHWEQTLDQLRTDGAADRNLQLVDQSASAGEPRERRAA